MPSEHSPLQHLIVTNTDAVEHVVMNADCLLNGNIWHFRQAHESPWASEQSGQSSWPFDSNDEFSDVILAGSLDTLSESLELHAFLECLKAPPNVLPLPLEITTHW